MPLLSGNADLTSKEWAITALVFEGHTNAEIAAETRTTERARKWQDGVWLVG